MDVTVRNLTIGEGKPKICVLVMGKNKTEVLEAAKKAVESKADLIEWRADSLTEGEFDEDFHNEILAKMREIIGEMPIIYTFRTLIEGGKEIENEKYKDLILSVANAGITDLIDVEIFSFKLKARDIIDEIHSFTNVKVIGSYHDFEGTPDTAELVYRLSVIDNCNADILKIATMPHKKKDVMRIMTATILTYTRPNPKPIISIAMGSMGRITRLLGGFTGSAITFASIGRSSAPGQMDIEDVREILTKLDEVL
nr:type I 3-dehydroquinate dehydratase [uncultured Catonella sp.]